MSRGADPVPGRLLVVQPSADYAFRVRRHVPDALFLATPDRARELAGHPVVTAPLDAPDQVAEAVRRHLAPAGRLDGITCFVCEGLQVTAQLAADLGLPFHSPHAVRRSRNKDAALLVWQEAGVPVPASRFVGGLPDLLDFAGSVPPPWVLKPTNLSGSEWVLRVDDPADLLAAHLRIRDGLTPRDRRRRIGEPRYMVQEFVQGREVSADLYVDGGRVARVLRWTEKYLVHEPGLAGLVGAYFPPHPPLTAAQEARLVQVYGRAAAALGVERGVVMVDGILRDGTPHLLEMGLRPGGDCLPDLCQKATGYDPIRATCQVALGHAPDGPDRAMDSIAALHLMADQGGTISVLDLSALTAHPDVLHVDPYRGVGDVLRVWAGSYDDRIVASCLVRFGSPQELPGLVKQLSGRIRLEVAAGGRAVQRRA